MNINKREVFRYLGYQNHMPDEQTDKLVDEVVAQLMKQLGCSDNVRSAGRDNAERDNSKRDSTECDNVGRDCGTTCKNIQRKFVLSFEVAHQIHFVNEHCSFTLKSKDLSTNLRGCEEAVLFAATLGNAPDQLMSRYEITDMTKAVVLQAASAMLIEAYCDEIQEAIRVKESSRGYFLRPRFSPGYGDLPISEQRKIFQVLECEKRIGLTLTDTMMMLPTKSVTALIGLTKEVSSCHIGKCKQCSKKDCEFRHE